MKKHQICPRCKDKGKIRKLVAHNVTMHHLLYWLQLHGMKCENIVDLVRDGTVSEEAIPCPDCLGEGIIIEKEGEDD